VARGERRSSLGGEREQVHDRGGAAAFFFGDLVHQQRIQAGFAHPLERHVDHVCRYRCGWGWLRVQQAQRAGGRCHHACDAPC